MQRFCLEFLYESSESLLISAGLKRADAKSLSISVAGFARIDNQKNYSFTA